MWVVNELRDRCVRLVREVAELGFDSADVNIEQQAASSGEGIDVFKVSRARLVKSGATTLDPRPIPLGPASSGPMWGGWGGAGEGGKGWYGATSKLTPVFHWSRRRQHSLTFITQCTAHTATLMNS